MDSTISELYFLIAKFLSGGPCQRASQTLIEELESNEILPKSVNWLGQGITQDFKTFSSKFNHINADHLPKLLEQLVKIVNAKEHASTVASRSLLSSSTLALLDKADLSSRKSSGLTWSKKHVSHHFRQVKHKRNVPHPVHAITERPISGDGVGNHLIKPAFYERMAIACNTLGHLSAVYCVLFDVTGRFIFTGADDHLVKIWSVIDGRLLFTFRGTTSEVTDLAVNQENTLIAVASCDKTIRVWCLRTCAPVAVLTAHSGNVTSVFFCPVPRSRSVIRYLASTSTDGSCAFWAYTDDPGEPVQFQPKPTLYLERMRPGSAQMICSSFSSGGSFMAAGSADNHVRVYYMLGTDGPERILEVEHHTERVDSISWAHEGIKFVSGSKDGTALIWRFDCGGCWRYIRLHCGKNPGEPAVIYEDPKRRPRVTMVGWNADDSLVLTAVSDQMIKVWNATTGELIRVLKGHSDEAYVIEAHPFNPRVICTAGHDGKLIIWDVGTTKKDDKDPSIGKVYEYYNQLGEGHGHGSLFDCKWSPDGFSIAMTDSHGHMMLLTVAGDKIQRFKRLPGELFFHTDYRPILRDAITNQILDEQTQVAPHLMPPPFLVDVDGNPYPPQLQRLVPGRERLKEEYLIPNVAVGASGYQEVIEGIPVRSNIDEMIQQLAIEQGLERNRQAAERERENERRGIGNRRSGEVEGVRQSRVEWQTGNCSQSRKYVIPPLPEGVAESLEELRRSCVEAEEAYYRDQSKKMSPSNSSNNVANALGSPVDGSPNGRARRLRLLARDAAERRRNQPQSSNPSALLETEGVARPNPRPQMEISVSQESPRRPLARGTNRNPVNNRRPRPVRFDVRRTLREHGESDIENVELEEESFSEAHVSTTESSSSEDSDSDWGGTLGTSRTREENKRKVAGEVRKRSQRLNSNSSGDDGTQVKQDPEESEGGDLNDDNEPKPGPSTEVKIKTEPVKPTRTRKARSKQVDYSGGLEEIPELYRPSEWLAEILPKRSPYLPQIGDEIVYYRQGHEAYIKEIEAKNTYTIPNKLKKQLPYVQKPDLEPEVSARVIAIKFELEPPRLVALKLTRTHWESGELINGSNFYVKYHDIADVVDFLILRQMYDKSTSQKWNDGDKFRCLIQEEWWLGTVERRTPFSAAYPDSNYMCYKVKWNNGDPELMSPWDMDIVTDDFEIPDGCDALGVPASTEDLRIGMYESSVGDWPPHGHQEAQCQKISTLLEQVMGLAISEAFLTPVDLNMYPDYAHTIEYPIDLSTIKARLDNLFYRRVDALRFDIKYIAMNAEKFNQLDSTIVKNARVIRDVCLEIMTNPDTVDVNAFYHATMKKYTNANKSLKADGSSGSKSKASSSRTSKKGKKKDKELQEEYDTEEEQVAWESKCLEILNDIFERNDATPFRQPVDITVFPDYSRVIDTPMDLQTVREELLGGNYESPQDFNKDMIMIFSNSRHYNTDLRSNIYQMTRRLQSVYESRFHEMIKSMKRKKKGKQKKSATKTKEFNKNKSRYMPSRAASSAHSTPRKNPKRSVVGKNRFSTHEEESSDAADETGHYLRNRSRSTVTRNVLPLNGSPRRGLRNGHAGPSSSKTNGYASSSPQRYSTRNSSGARPVKRLRISSGDSHPSTRNSPRRGTAPNRFSNTSSRGSNSTTPDGPSTSRAALKRVKMTIKDDPSDEFEDSDDSVSMPILNEEHDRSDEASDYDSDDQHTAVRRSSRVSLKRTRDWSGRSRRETRNQGRQRPNYAEPRYASEEDERSFGKRRRVAPTRASPMRAVSTRHVQSQPPPLRKSNSFHDSDSEQEEVNQEDSEVSDGESDPDKPGPSSKLLRQMNRGKKVTNGNSSALRNGKGKSVIKNALKNEDDEEESEEERVDEEESEEEEGSDEDDGESEDEGQRSRRRKSSSKPQPRYSPRKAMSTKRRHESSDDEYTTSPIRRTIKKQSTSKGGGSSRRATRGVKINYGEGSDDDDDSEPPRVTVSSRGRVRRTKSFLGD